MATGYPDFAQYATPQSVVLMERKVQTVSVSCEWQTNLLAKGAFFFIRTQAIVGSQEVHLGLYYRTPEIALERGVGLWLDVCSVAGIKMYAVYPGITDIKNALNGVQDIPIGREWRITMIFVGSGSVDYTVGMHYIY